MFSRIPFHHVAMSFRKAVRIAIRPTATIASSSPYSAIAAPSSSRRKRRTPCIMRFMRELLGKDGWDLQRVRRQGVTPLSLGRSDERHRTAAVSGGEGDCKESTDPVGHPTTGAVRLQLRKQGLIERLFRTPARLRGPTRYGGIHNDLRRCRSPRFGGSASAALIDNGAPFESLQRRLLGVDLDSACRASATGGAAGHQAPAWRRYTRGESTQRFGVRRPPNTAFCDPPSAASAPRPPTAVAPPRRGWRSPNPRSAA